MGAFIILRITFKEKSYLDRFINKYKPLILVNDDSKSFGFEAWRLFWKKNTIICYVGFLGYAEPNQIKRDLKDKITYFDFIPINDFKSRWDKDRV